MSRVTPRISSAERVILLKLTDFNGSLVWSRQGGNALYESRALTEMGCQGLVKRGYMDEVREDGNTVYRVNQDGANAAADLRAEMDGWPVSTRR